MKQSKSQWNFSGELFATEEIRKVLTVSELTGSVRHSIEKEFAEVWVTGEISNLRVQPSGHVYFSLKDANAQLSCVLFRNEATAINRDFLLDGQKVVVHGSLTVYEARGQYQLRVLNVELRGMGALQAAFERLKVKLQGEGLFAQERKRVLPRYIRRIGIVTSLVGAAIRDVLHVVQRRDASLEIILVSCRVQGMGAGQEIGQAIELLNQWVGISGEALDLILLTRGGGSLEDLWAFNEEVVARAIFNSKLPIISGVGHEIDFTISDFVADLRAATPSAAAELITEGVFGSRQFIREARERLREIARARIEGKLEALEALEHRLNRLHPRRNINQFLQRLDDLHSSINRCVRIHARDKAARFQTAGIRLLRAKPSKIIQRRQERAVEVGQRLRSMARTVLMEKRGMLTNLETKLRLLSPMNILDRGYSITYDAKTGTVVENPDSVKPGDEIVSRLARGRITSAVRKTEAEHSKEGS